ncbi:MAG: HPF/RaiA family ribosome-associated protein [Albidovulum sp.]
MPSEPQIVFHGIDASPAATDAIRGRLGKCGQVFDRITALRVVGAKRSSRGHERHLCRVEIDAEVPGGLIAVNHKSGDRGAQEDLHVAIRDAFDAARRQLEAQTRRMRSVHGKTRAERHNGRFTGIVADDGDGFVLPPVTSRPVSSASA